MASTVDVFQSTRPRRARHPRALVGLRGGPVSIHAPVKGATRASPSRPASRGSFNPRVREGRDQVKQTANIREYAEVSIHAPVKGATSTASQDATGGRGFNPRAREGRDGALSSGGVPV